MGQRKHKLRAKRKLQKQEVIDVDADEPADDIILVDSNNLDVSDVLVEDDEPGSINVPAESEPVDNEITRGNDFIEFGFSSSEEDNAEGSDDGVLSDDHSGRYRTASRSKLPYPWVQGQDHLKQKEIADWLTLEIKDFINYISPSKEEIENRNEVIATLKSKIKDFWPATNVHVFGSSATDLYLPGSDIDIVILSSTGMYEQRQKLYQLSSFLRSNKLAKEIEVIATAKVPIIKFIDTRYNLQVDVSFERRNGLDAAKRIRHWLDSTPGLRELVMIVKQFLRTRKLHYVRLGGLGGYATIIMVYHFLKLHPRVSTNSVDVQANLGALLIEFFELYGCNFAYDNLILALDGDQPTYLLKLQHQVLSSMQGMAGRGGLFRIVIQDPADHTNNITRSLYNLRDIRKAFYGAYQLLTEKCYDMHAMSFKKRIGRLILGDIIEFRGKLRDFNDDRDKVVNDALIDHHAVPESNDRFYFSDMLSEDERPAKKRRVALPEKAKQQVESLLGIRDDDERPKASVDKADKRDYWRQKGLEI